MRNLAEYPVTANECLELLEKTRLNKELERKIGSTDLLCLSKVILFLESNKEAFENSLRSANG